MRLRMCASNIKKSKLNSTWRTDDTKNAGGQIHNQENLTGAGEYEKKKLKTQTTLNVIPHTDFTKRKEGGGGASVMPLCLAEPSLNISSRRSKLGNPNYDAKGKSRRSSGGSDLPGTSIFSLDTHENVEMSTTSG